MLENHTHTKLVDRRYTALSFL